MKSPSLLNISETTIFVDSSAMLNLSANPWLPIKTSPIEVNAPTAAPIPVNFIALLSIPKPLPPFFALPPESSALSPRSSTSSFASFAFDPKLSSESSKSLKSDSACLLSTSIIIFTSFAILFF